MAGDAPNEIRAKLADSWGSVADAYIEYADDIEEFLEPATATLFDMARLARGDRILDVACGAGQPGLRTLSAIGADGRLVGVDIAPDMVRAAKVCAEQERAANATFCVCAMEQLPFAAGSFDRVLCRCGLMFSPEPLRALREFRRVLRPGGVFAGCVWAERAHNPWADIPITIIDGLLDTPPPQPGMPGAFVMGTTEIVDSLMNRAGYENIVIQHVSHLATDQNADEYWRRMKLTAGPLRRAFDRLTAAQRAEVDARTIEGYRACIASGGIAGHSICFMGMSRR